jgi:hypothetical protein
MGEEVADEPSPARTPDTVVSRPEDDEFVTVWNGEIGRHGAGLSERWVGIVAGCSK